MDHAIRASLVRTADHCLASCRVGQDDSVTVAGGGRRPAAARRQARLALTVVDRLGDVGKDFPRQDMAGQDLGQQRPRIGSAKKAAGNVEVRQLDRLQSVRGRYQSRFSVIAAASMRMPATR